MRVWNILIIGLVTLAVTPAFGQTVYTEYKAFEYAIKSYTVQHEIDFDDQASGSYAGYYGKMNISPTGLDSDGLTWITTYPIATNAFSTTGSPNALGTQNADHSFLAGNSDMVQFNFAKPVHAFGLLLVGNPSPTGDPAIPFWRMHINTASGFDALSTTDPLYTIDSGNDVYFFGVTSIREPFNQVTLYSNNDSAAVFSFNIDNVVYATNARAVTLNTAKNSRDGAPVLISDIIVTRAHNTQYRFNVETADRTTGIAVIGSGAVRGDSLSFLGWVSSTSDDEKVIELDEIIGTGGSTMPPKPFGMSSLALGGKTDIGLQIGIPDSIGPNNIGLDVTIWGKITAIDTNPYAGYMIVDDGARRTSEITGAKGIMVVGNINAGTRSIGDFVVVRGSSSIHKSTDGKHYPIVRVAEIGDITP